LRIIIFGSNGLVGTSLKRVLSNQNYISELFSSTREDTDLFDFQNTKNTIEKFKPDLIINAAAKVGGILANNSFRTQFILENLKINMNILESITSKPKIKMINLGSSCIYPLNAKNPINENELMNGRLEPTNSPYAMAKLTAIEIGDALRKQYGHKILNIMPTNLYGPNDNFSHESSHVIPGLIYKMHKAVVNQSSSLEIWGSGNPLREFMHVDDLASAIIFLLKKEVSQDILNIGSGEEVSIKVLANKIKSVVNFEGELIFNDKFPDGNPRKLLDSSTINKLGWSSSIDLDSGLKSTYEWYKNNLTT